jgi:hypothetical protein
LLGGFVPGDDRVRRLDQLIVGLDRRRLGDIGAVDDEGFRELGVETGPARKVGENPLVPLLPATVSDSRGRFVLRAGRRLADSGVGARFEPAGTR